MCWMMMPAVSCIYYRYSRKAGSKQRCSFFWVSHYNCICVAGNSPYCVREAFSFGCRTGRRLSKSQAASPQTEHCSFKRKACSGTGFKKKCSQYPPPARFPKISAVTFDFFCQRKKPVHFFRAEIPWFNERSSL